MIPPILPNNATNTGANDPKAKHEDYDVQFSSIYWYFEAYRGGVSKDTKDPI